MVKITVDKVRGIHREILCRVTPEIVKFSVDASHLIHRKFSLLMGHV